MARWIRTLLAALVVFTLHAQAQPAWACSCVPPSPPAQAFGQAAAVFSGRVTGSGDALWPVLAPLAYAWRTLAPAYTPPSGRLVSFTVGTSWRGVDTTTVQVTTGYSSADCGYDFQVGGDYVVYAYAGAPARAVTGEGWSTNVCLRTAPVAAASADLVYLNQQPALALSAAPASFTWVWVLGLAFIGLAGAVALGLARRPRAARATHEDTRL